MIMNTTTTIIALGAIVPHKFTHFSFETDNDKYDRAFDVLSHTIPMICETINFFALSNTVSYFFDSWIVPAIIGPYYIVNYFWVKETDDPPYPFMLWDEKDEMSIIVEVSMPFIGFLVHWVWCLITQYAIGRLEWEQPWWKKYVEGVPEFKDMVLPLY
jgi:hypothetical protein